MMKSDEFPLIGMHNIGLDMFPLNCHEIVRKYWKG